MYRMGPVARENLLENSLRLLRKASAGQLLSEQFTVYFQGEMGTDLGGVTRDWFDSLANELSRGSEQRERNSSDDLFSLSLLALATDGTLLPRPSGYTDANCKRAPEQLQERWARLAAIGRFLGVAVLRSKPLPLSFGQVLMKLLCERAVSYSDVRHLDADFYKHRIVSLLEEGGVEKASAALTVPLTFISAPTDLMPDQVPLKEGGNQIPVTEENKMEYIELLSEARICNGRRHELQFFVSGFHEVIPVDVLKQANVSPTELSLLISGVHVYSVDEWRQHAKETGDRQVLKWFWQVVTSFTEEQRALLMHFSTGSSRLPPRGFEGVEPRFKVCITGEDEERVPTAHTCVNQLDIPKYSSMEVLEKKLSLAISSESGFGLA
jgi:E3 ubiquitin-protein ligase HUWE1